MGARIIGTGGRAAVEIPAGRVVDRVYPNRRPPNCERSESTNACPMPPTPGGSVVPRANTISTSGHGSAAAVGRWISAIGRAHAVAAMAPRMRIARCARVVSMYLCRTATPRCHSARTRHDHAGSSRFEPSKLPVTAGTTTRNGVCSVQRRDLSRPSRAYGSTSSTPAPTASPG